VHHKSVVLSKVFILHFNILKKISQISSHMDSDQTFQKCNYLNTLFKYPGSRTKIKQGPVLCDITFVCVCTSSVQ